MLITNFLKRTITIIYILVLLLAFLLIYIVTIMDNFRVDFYNTQYKDAYIEFKSSYEDLDRIKSIANITDNITLGISNKINDTPELFWLDKSLHDGELIAAPKVFPNKQIGDKITFEYYIPYEFTIIAFNSQNNALSYISEEALMAIGKYYDEIYYQVTLHDWTKLDNTILKINDNYIFEQGHQINVRGFYNTDDLTIYDIRYYIFRTILIAIIILDIYFVVKELYKEEKESYYMYYCLGFTKKKLILLSLTKLLLIIAISALIFGIILTVLML